MKKMTMLLMMLILTAPVARAQEVASAGAPEGHTIQVKAKGLVCDYCVRALEKMFRKRPEVKDFSVDLTTKVITIRFKEGQSLDDATVQGIINESGYSPAEIERVERV